MKISREIISSLLLAVLILSSLVVLGQQSTKVLTNDDVIRMVKQGLADNVIVSTIQRFPANYDLSPDALIQMNKQGVSSNILAAMQEAEKLKAQKTNEVTASSESTTQQKRVSRISNDFVFELNVCQSSGGDSVICWFFITNKAQERKIYITLASHIDDNLGDRYLATDVRIANSVRRYAFETSVSNTLIPGNPLAAVLKFQNVKPEAKLIRTLRIIYGLDGQEFKVDFPDVPITPKPQASPTPKVELQQQEKQKDAKDGGQTGIPIDEAMKIINPAPIQFKYQVKRFSLDVRQRLDLCTGTITLENDSLEIRTDSNKSQLGYNCNSNTYHLTKNDIQKLKDSLNGSWYELRPTADYLYIKFAVVENNDKDKKKREFYLYPAQASIKYGTRTQTLTNRVLVCPDCPAIICPNCKPQLEAMKNLLDAFYSQRKPTSGSQPVRVYD